MHTTKVDIILIHDSLFSKWTKSCSVVVVTTAQLHSTKPKLRFYAGSNPACGVSEICDGEDL